MISVGKCSDGRLQDYTWIVYERNERKLRLKARRSLGWEGWWGVVEDRIVLEGIRGAGSKMTPCKLLLLPLSIQTYCQ